ANPSAVSRDGATALHDVAERGDGKAVELLLSHGADIEAQAAGGRRPLHCAAERGHLAVLQALLRNGAEAAAVTEEGKGPMMLAAARGHLTAVQCLLESGVNVQAADSSGQEALHAAASAGHTQILAMLLAWLADPEATDKAGRTAMHLALAAHQDGAVRVLVLNGARVPPEVEFAPSMMDLVFEVKEGMLRGQLALEPPEEVWQPPEPEREAQEQAGMDEDLHSEISPEHRSEAASSEEALQDEGDGSEKLNEANDGPEKGDEGAKGELNEANEGSEKGDEGAKGDGYSDDGDFDFIEEENGTESCGEGEGKEGNEPVFIREMSSGDLQQQQQQQQHLAVINEAEGRQLEEEDEVRVEVGVEDGVHFSEDEKELAAAFAKKEKELEFAAAEKEAAVEGLAEREQKQARENEPTVERLAVAAAEEEAAEAEVAKDDEEEVEVAVTEEEEAAKEEVAKEERAEEEAPASSEVPSPPVAGPSEQKKMVRPPPLPWGAELRAASAAAIDQGRGSQRGPSSCCSSSRCTSASSGGRPRSIPDSMNSAAGKQVVDDFLRLLGEKVPGGSIARAWLRHVDIKKTGAVKFPAFCKILVQLGFNQDVMQLWHALSGPHRGAVSLGLEAVDPDSAEVLAAMGRWCKENCGGVLQAFSAVDQWSMASGSVAKKPLLEGLRRLNFFSAHDEGEEQELLDNDTHLLPRSEEEFLSDVMSLLDPWDHNSVLAEDFLMLEQDSRLRKRLLSQLERSKKLGAIVAEDFLDLEEPAPDPMSSTTTPAHAARAPSKDRLQPSSVQRHEPPADFARNDASKMLFNLAKMSTQLGGRHWTQSGLNFDSGSRPPRPPPGTQSESRLGSKPRARRPLPKPLGRQEQNPLVTVAESDDGGLILPRLTVGGDKAPDKARGMGGSVSLPELGGANGRRNLRNPAVEAAAAVAAVKEAADAAETTAGLREQRKHKKQVKTLYKKSQLDAGVLPALPSKDVKQVPLWKPQKQLPGLRGNLMVSAKGYQQFTVCFAIVVS
ncbi:unnamed protein product, partial [Polarella glacialis]